MSSMGIVLRKKITGILLAVVAIFTSVITPVLAQSEPKKVLLIGATVNSAPTFFHQAFDLGYEVSGIARRPEFVEVKDERLTIFKGDAYDQKSIEDALARNTSQHRRQQEYIHSQYTGAFSSRSCCLHFGASRIGRVRGDGRRCLQLML